MKLEIFHKFRSFSNYLFLRDAFALSGLMFFSFLIARFAGLTFFPALRYLYIPVLASPLVFVRLGNHGLFHSVCHSTFKYFTFCLSGSFLFAIYFFFWLIIDPWYYDYLRIYSSSVLGSNIIGAGMFMGFELLEFSIIASLSCHYIGLVSPIKEYAQSENDVSREIA
jgi:hypothetical protein